MSLSLLQGGFLTNRYREVSNLFISFIDTAFCRSANEEACCGCCPQPTSSQHFGSALPVPEPCFYTGMFHKVDPYSNLENYSVLVIVPLQRGH